MAPGRNHEITEHLHHSEPNHVYSTGTDPLVHHGRHFGRTVHGLCMVQTLLHNGLLRMGELADQPKETFSVECVFRSCSPAIIDLPAN